MSKIYIANWKNQQSVDGAKIFFEKFRNTFNNDQVIICPHDAHLFIFRNNTINYDIGLQKIDQIDASVVGTGVTDINLAKDFGVKYAIVGHLDFNHTDSYISKTIRCINENNIIPIVCFGNNLKSYNDSVVKSLSRFVTLGGCKKIIVAYEPAWAIGTGNAASIDDINNACNAARNYFSNLYGKTIDLKVIYGGSVSSENAQSITTVCDGLMVGKSSIDAKCFMDIIKKSKG